MASVATWSTTAASNTSVGGISTDGNVTLVNQLDNMTRGMMAEVATSRDDGTIINVYPRGYLFGLTLSNNAGDATNDIDIAVGECVASDTPYWRMALASALTKRLDAAWAVGTGNGGLDTGVIANTTYHIWLIARSDTGVVDALFSASATSPTMPTNYDRKRRIGSIRRNGGAILAFRQTGDTFRYATALLAVSSGAAFASTLTSLGIPVGLSLQPILRVNVAAGGGSTVSAALGDAATGLADVNVVGCVSAAGVAGSATSWVPSGFFSDTNTSLYVSFTISVGTGTITVNTQGWIDLRGRT